MKYLDKIQHAAISIVIVVIAYLIFDNAYYGAVAAIAGFFGREHAAAVWYRRQQVNFAETYLKSDLACLKIWAWRLDNQLDFYVSFVAAPVAYLLMML